MVIDANLKEFIDTLYIAGQYVIFGIVDFLICCFCSDSCDCSTCSKIRADRDH